jgi:hypothetical protein
MLIAAIVLFGIAALGGTVLAKQAKSGKPSTGLAVGHGALAAAGLVILLVAFARGDAGGLVTAALVLFVGAALGGFFLFSLHLRNQPLPQGLIAGHALAAIAGLVLLLVALLG